MRRIQPQSKRKRVTRPRQAVRARGLPMTPASLWVLVMVAWPFVMFGVSTTWPGPVVTAKLERHTGLSTAAPPVPQPRRPVSASVEQGRVFWQQPTPGRIKIVIPAPAESAVPGDAPD